MNGAAALRRRSPRVTDFTIHGRPSSDVTTACVSASVPSSAFCPATSFSVATNSGGDAPLSRAWSDQYSTGTKA